MAKTYNPMPQQAKVARAFIWVQGIAVLLLTGVAAWPVVTGLGEISNIEKFLVHVLGVPAGVAVPDRVPAFVREQHWPVVAAAGVAALLWLLFGLLLRTQKRVLWVVVLVAEFALMAADVAAIWVVDAPLYGALLGLVVPLIVVGYLLARISRRWFHH